ncbi:hypothetical protein [Paenibacillus xerothermodurans]|uniref:Uncharacterized protein n=1 Tax=Paenibacillus xerothermodurans TaxID=1977292 RepID=A0A2W1NK82_PAEXE|nr:hypothetical protein [Paenibacillus xerothermodurans]PZE19855.1 hypothetical protein CBW46_016130 [Paenibacillus xerothermodurans]
MTEYILVSSTERYKTVTDNPDLETVAEYEYLFFGKKKTTFSICKIKNPGTRIVIQGVAEVFPDNSIPLKVFPKFDSTEAIEKEIYELDMDEESKIVKVH